MESLSLVRSKRLPLRQERAVRDHAPRFIATPAVLEQIQREVAYAAETGSHLRVAGRGHTRAPLCRCDDGLLQLSRFTGIEDIDAVHGIVWARSGTRLSTLARELASYGLALPTLGWPGGESIGGAVSIGGYGIGIGDSTQPSPVIGLRMVGADGAIFSIGANDERLPLARVSLGTLGVISHVGLRCVPAGKVRARLSRSTLPTVLHRTEALRGHDYVEWYWLPPGDNVQIRFVDRAGRKAPPATDLPRTVPPWMRDLLLHARMELYRGQQRWLSRGLPDHVRDDEAHDDADAWRLFDGGRELASVGFACPVPKLAETLARFCTLLRAIDPGHRMMVRVRYARADDAALSPAYGDETAIIDVMARRQRGAEAHLEAAADMLARSGARPLWTMPREHHAAELAEMYPHWQRFLDLRAQLDPHGLFLNDYLAGVFGVAENDGCK